MSMADILPFPIPPSSCPRCHGERWVCEDHPDQPMTHEDCSGVGMPCPTCNTVEPPDLPEGFQTIVTNREE